jgi:hypothetical protein
VGISADIGAELQTYLLTVNALSTLVGTRIYPDVLPQSYRVATGGAIVYETKSATPTNSLSEHHDTERVRIQYDCYGSTRPAADALARALQTALEAKRQGALTSLSVTELTIDSGIVDETVPPQDGSDAWRYVASLDILCFYF